jgi:hypothetical protein
MMLPQMEHCVDAGDSIRLRLAVHVPGKLTTRAQPQPLLACTHALVWGWLAGELLIDREI